ncbi:uncharacterized protein HaLaN_07175 [Haematococcus lacustris]|uniref:ADP,ATP carrier protein n=2 Tax=Haematococcus lacustris TaxID=44745 RepID=A0A699YNF4_HAELA|nr:uncharacterized protein HaLaN_07175 [Haematococcus lacustris]
MIILQVQGQSSLAPGDRYTGWLDALRRIPQREGGWKALYRGNGANIVRLVPEVAFKFVVHDQLKIILGSTDSNPSGMVDRMAAGAATGVLKSLLFYPLDLARTRITADLAAAGQARNYASIRHCLSRTFAQEGVLGLYKGLGLSMLGVVPYMSVSLATYDSLKEQLPLDKFSRAQWWYPLAKMGCGCAAAAAAQVVTYPLDTVRRRMQMNGAQGTSVRYRGALDCVRTIIRTEGGVTALYRGVGVGCLKTFPGAAMQFVAYDLIKTGIMFLDPTTGVSSPL